MIDFPKLSLRCEEAQTVASIVATVLNKAEDEILAGRHSRIWTATLTRHLDQITQDFIEVMLRNFPEFDVDNFLTVARPSGNFKYKEESHGSS